MTGIEIAIVCTTLFTVVGTLLALLKTEHWLIRQFDFPRLQFAGLALITMVPAVWFLDATVWWHHLVLLSLAAVVLYQSYRIFPYTPFAPKSVKHAERSTDPDNSIALLVSNVLQPNHGADKLLAHIETMDPDIIITLESDSWWEKSLSSLEERYPYMVKVPQDNLYGMHLYSRLKLIEPEVQYLIDDEYPSIETGVELGSGTRLRFFAVHPPPPSPTEAETSTERDGELLTVGRRIEGNAKATLIAGDLNDVAWSDTTRLFRDVSGLLDPRVGRGFFNTFHASIPFLRWPLDHVFVSPEFRVIKMERLGSIGSDHFPIYAKFSYEPEGSDSQDPPEASREEEEEATDKIERANGDQDRAD